jgi:uncharacterized protein with FMN-binding domain
MTVRNRRGVRTCTALLLGSTAAVAPLISAARPATAAPNPGQSIWNDYGQSPTEVTAEVTSQVNATPAVVRARQAVATAHATVVSLTKAQSAARAAYLKAVKAKSKSRISRTHRAYAAAQRRTAAAHKAEGAAKAALAKVLASTTAAIRAQHYTPVDGTYTGSVAQYFVPDLGLEPVQVRITVSGGHVSGVSAPVYTKTGDSGSYNAMAIPTLIEEALAAGDTANVATVSGATLTSEGFAKSLQSALGQAGFPA